MDSVDFLSIPLEIRRLVYRLCIPQNMRFNCSYDMYHQNRPQGWYEPDWHRNENLDRYDEKTQDTRSGGGDYSNDWDEDQVDSDDKKQLSLWQKSIEDRSTFGVDSDEDQEHEYDQFAPDDYCQPISHKSALPGLLLICRQITDEATAMLYKGNIFEVTVHGGGQRDFKTRFCSQTRAKMRNILLALRPMGVSYRPNFRMDPSIWHETLNSLWVLGIVAEQPRRLSQNTWPSVDTGKVFEEWTLWLTPIL